MSRVNVLFRADLSVRDREDVVVEGTEQRGEAGVDEVGFFHSHFLHVRTDAIRAPDGVTESEME